MSATSALSNIGGAAATGATLGSVVPGVGTALGAGVGAGLGALGTLYDYLVSSGTSDEEAQRIIAATRNTFQAAGADVDHVDFNDVLRVAQGQQSAGFAQAQNAGVQQQALTDLLRDRAEGRGGPSLAEMQLQQATDRNARLAAGAIASQRGVAPGMAARLASRAQTDANQEAVGQTAMLRAQEQQAAQAALMQQLAQQRGQDLQQQGAASQLFGTGSSAYLGQRGQDVQNSLGAQQINADVARGNQQAAMSAYGMGQQQQQQDADRSERMTGAIASGAGAVGAKVNSQPGTTGIPGTSYGLPGDDGFVPAPPKLASGGPVPGRAPVAGDSPRNDTVMALLSPGEVVLPRSIAMHPNAPELAAAFVDEIRKRRAPQANALEDVLAARVGGR